MKRVGGEDIIDHRTRDDALSGRRRSGFFSEAVARSI